MSGLKARLYQASLNPSHPCRRGPNTENFFLRNSTNNESWERDNENNFDKLYFCLTPSYIKLLLIFNIAIRFINDTLAIFKYIAN